MIKSTLCFLLLAGFAHAQPCHLVKDIHVGGSSAPSGFAWMQDRVFFWGTSGNNERQMWSSNGSPSSTFQITNLEITTNGTDSPPMVIGDSLLIFLSFTWPTGNELWRSNGSLGSETMITDLNPGTSGSISMFGRSDGKYTYFISGGGLQNGLYRTDGTEAGTLLLKQGINGFSRLVMMGGNAYFKVYFQGDTWLLKTDGTVTGTSIISKIQLQNVTTIPDNLVIFNGELYFLKEHDDDSWGLWKTDGTAAGTEMRVSLNPPAVGNPHSLTLVNDRLFLIANDGTSSRLLVSDGTQTGTSVVTEINPAGPITGISDMIGLGNHLIFSGRDTNHGWELWISDGTLNGTHLLKDIEPSGESSPRFQFSHAVVMDSFLFFMATTNDFGKELWQTDGTANGTFMVQDICVGPCSAEPSNLFPDTQNRFFFRAFTTEWGTEPWVYDPLNTMVADPVRKDNSFILYPNPTSRQNLVHLAWEHDWSPEKVEVLDFQGRVLNSIQLLIDEKRSTIALPELPTGMYLLKIYDDAGSVIGLEKLVVL